MYCKKCKYHGFDHVSACPKCGVSWEEARKSLFLDWMTVNKRPWTYAVSDTSDAPKPPAVSNVFQPKEAADISLNTNLSLGDDEFSGDLLQETPIAVTPQQPAQKETDQIPEVEFNLDDVLPKDSVDAMDDTSIIPELDFSLDISETADSAASSASQKNFQAANLDNQELEIELPILTLEPDTLLQSPTPTDPHEDLYIPSLEEIFSSTSTGSGGSQTHKSTDADIILDLNKS